MLPDNQQPAPDNRGEAAPDNQEPGTDNGATAPPRGVALVARTHLSVGGSILGAIIIVQAVIQKFPVEASTRTYVITLSLAALYLLAGTLVWFGIRPGRFLSRACGLIYLARPPFGSPLWRIMDSEEFRAHFVRKRKN